MVPVVVALLELEVLPVGDSVVSEVSDSPLDGSNCRPNEIHAAVTNNNSSRHLCPPNLNVQWLSMSLEFAGAILCGMSSSGGEKQQFTFDSERRRSFQTIDRKAYPARGLAQIATDHKN